METMFMQNFGRQTKSIMVFLKVVYMTRSAVSMLTVSWPHTLKTANVRSCGIFSSAFLFCLMDRLVLNGVLA